MPMATPVSMFTSPKGMSTPNSIIRRPRCGPSLRQGAPHPNRGKDARTPSRTVEAKPIAQQKRKTGGDRRKAIK
ncbi:hypothetical protein CR513_60304, partial [Mucuna pruriens]